jgi:fumarate reductase (CoM/CoB) subunit A
MWEKVGPVRDGGSLEEGLAEIESIEEQAQDLRITQVRRCNAEVAEAVELPNMLVAARAIAACALGRAESRGAHVRSDFPERDDAGPVRNMVVEMKDGSCELRRVEISE